MATPERKNDRKVLNKYNENSRSRKARTTIRYYPPQNFGMVEEDLYRSSLPTSVNFPFLDTLKLKTIIYLSSDDPSEKLIQFCEEQNITFIRPEAVIQSQSKLMTLPEEAVIQSLDTLLDSRHYPVLVSCQLGRHKTGMVIGCLRKLQRWSLSSIYAEYQRYAGKTRLHNEQFIELFDSDLVSIPRTPVEWFTLLQQAQREICESRKLDTQAANSTLRIPSMAPSGSDSNSVNVRKAKKDGGGAFIRSASSMPRMEKKKGTAESTWSFEPPRPLSTSDARPTKMPSSNSGSMHFKRAPTTPSIPLPRSPLRPSNARAEDVVNSDPKIAPVVHGARNPPPPPRLGRTETYTSTTATTGEVE